MLVQTSEVCADFRSLVVRRAGAYSTTPVGSGVPFHTAS